MFKEYVQHTVLPNVHTFISEVNERTLSTRALLTALGDFWTEYYSQTELLSQAMSGHSILLSKEYTHLLELIRSSNILTIPAERFEQFNLCAINLDELEYGIEDLCDSQCEKWPHTCTLDYDDTARYKEYYLLADTSVTSLNYLCSTLFESPIVLVEKSQSDNYHYEIVEGVGIKFYVDLVDDENIDNYVYRIRPLTPSGQDRVIFWACDLALETNIIYQRFGRFLYSNSYDSEKYEWFVTGLMSYFASTKTTSNLQKMMDVLYGIPYTRYDNETVLEIAHADSNLNFLDRPTGEDPYIGIRTDKAVYYTYQFSEVTVHKGDVLPRFTTLAEFHKVVDYIDEPYWWLKAGFPTDLIATTDNTYTNEQLNALMENILKYNTFLVKVSVTFETYATYVTQISKIRKLLTGGVPVYLYPVVKAVFKAHFEDVKSVWEQCEQWIEAFLKFADTHESVSLLYNGNHRYYLDPRFQHGCTDCEVMTYDGQHTYSDLNFTGYTRHHIPGLYLCARKYNGEVTYAGTHEISHLAKREEFHFEEIKFLQSDNWDWGNILTISQFYTRYSFGCTHAGYRYYGITTTYSEDSNPLSLTLYYGTKEQTKHLFETFTITRHRRVTHNSANTYSSDLLEAKQYGKWGEDIPLFESDVPVYDDGYSYVKAHKTYMKQVYAFSIKYPETLDELNVFEDTATLPSDGDITVTNWYRTWIHLDDTCSLPTDNFELHVLTLTFNEVVTTPNDKFIRYNKRSNI